MTVKMPVALCVTCLALSCARRPDSGPPLPALDRIVQMKATMYVPQAEEESGVKKVTFDVPEEYWTTIFSTLLPAVPHSLAEMWVVVGWIEITTKDGTSYSVMLGEGRFRIENPRGLGKYYITEDSLRNAGVSSHRGADSLQACLTNAYAASQSRSQ